MKLKSRPKHEVDIAAQLGLAVDNLEAVLSQVGMTSSDVDALFPHYGVLAGRLGAADVAPTTTMLGVNRVAVPGQMVELEWTAVV